MKRHISIAQHTCILQPCQPDPYARELDFHSHLSKLKTTLGELTMSCKHRAIVIQGNHCSGKSSLAAVLHQSGINTRLIDVLQSSSSDHRKLVDISHQINNPRKTYIIDNAEFANSDSFQAMTNHVNQQGTLILFCQDIPCSNSHSIAFTHFLLDCDTFRRVSHG